MTYCISYPRQKPRWFYNEAAKEYKKRLTRFCKIQETAGINQKNGRDLIIALSPDGIQLSSEEMAGRFFAAELGGKINRIIFMVKQDPFNYADEKWAFTSLDVADDLMIVLLLEQIYRAQKIMHNEPYHK